jgi:hypothetical protein
MARHVSSYHNHHPITVRQRTVRMHSEVNLLVVLYLFQGINENIFLWRNWTWPQRDFVIHGNFIHFVFHSYEVVQVNKVALTVRQIVPIPLKHFIQDRDTYIR